MNKPIETLNLSNRACNALKRNGYFTVDDIKNLTEKDLLSLKGLGRKLTHEIIEVISKW